MFIKFIKKLITKKWLKEVEFKVEKVYEFKKGGRYFFVLTTDRPISDQASDALKRALKANNRRLMKELGIVSSFIILDNGLDIKIIPSGEERKNNVV